MNIFNTTGSEGLIQNCEWKVKCPIRWEALDKTNRDGVRNCSVCAREVHLCETKGEIEQAIRNNWCVAIRENQRQALDHMAVGEIGSPPYR